MFYEDVHTGKTSHSNEFFLLTKEYKFSYFSWFVSMANPELANCGQLLKERICS